MIKCFFMKLCSVFALFLVDHSTADGLKDATPLEQTVSYQHTLVILFQAKNVFKSVLMSLV